MNNEVKYRLRRLTPEQKVAIVSDYNANIPILMILERHDISKRTLYRVLRQKIQRGEVKEENENEEQEKNGEQVANG